MEEVVGVVIALTRQAFRPKKSLTSICMEATFKCRLLVLSLLFAWPTLLKCSGHASNDCYTGRFCMA